MDYNDYDQMGNNNIINLKNADDNDNVNIINLKEEDDNDKWFQYDENKLSLPKSIY